MGRVQMERGVSMKVRTSVLLSTCVLLLLTLLLADSASAQLIVSANKTVCPTAGFTTIQSAVNAATAGQSIRICAGTYVEQVSINKSLTITADSGAILMPSAMQQNAASLTDAAPLATAILVTDATGVSITGLILDGANAGITECAPYLVGITYQNASGIVSHVTIRNFKLATNLNGCQSGLGIFVQSGGGQSSVVNISSSTVHDFQKNGITANETGTQITIVNNVVTGLGPTTGAAQNGIQVGFGANGIVSGNTVTNMLWSPCTSVSSCAAAATGILVTESDGVSVTSNVVGINQVGIFAGGSANTVESNQTFATSVFDGIHVEGNDSTIKSNRVFSASESGIFIDGNNNVVENNAVIEAAIGVLKVTGSTGNLFSGNSVYGTTIAMQDPGEKLGKLISPVR